MDSSRARSSATAYRRQRQIEACLLVSMQHTPYQAIHVSDLCRQVGISRKAFYNYFRDKDECLISHLRGVIRDTLLYVSENMPENATGLEICTILLNQWKERRPLLDLIVRNNLVGYFLWANTRFFLEEEPEMLNLLNTPDVKSDEDILAALISALTTFLLQWYGRGFDTPTEEMARKYMRLIYAPMLPLPEEKG